MKKNLLKIFALVFCFALFLTGCATVSDVKLNGKNVYYDDAKYYQGQVVKVGDYVYFGNGYTASDTKDFDYNKAKETGYLSRIDVSKSFDYSEDVEAVNKKHTTPNGVEVVNNEKLFGFQYQQMYALGEYIYFTSANTHKTSNMESDFSQISLFRVKYNGDDFKEIVKDYAFKTGEGSQITLQKLSDDNYYFLIAEPTDESTFTIKAIQVGDNVGELKTIVEDAKSYVLPDENSTVKNIVYTVDSGKEQTTTAIKSFDISAEEDYPIDNGEAGSETKLIDRVGDRIFYSYTMDSITEIYSISATSNNGYAPNSSKYFYASKSIKNVQKAGNGYVFIGESGALMYKEAGSSVDPVLLAESSQFEDVLFVQDDYVYLSNATSIKRISTIDKTLETVVEVEKMISGQCGYVDGYIYFYAQLGELELEEESEETAETDENYYMYRTDLNGNIQLLGKTK